MDNDIYCHLTEAGRDAVVDGADVPQSVVLLRSLMIDRDPVPEDQLKAEFEVVSEWARVAEAQAAQLEAVLKGWVRLSVTAGEVRLHLTETGRAHATMESRSDG